MEKVAASVLNVRDPTIQGAFKAKLFIKKIPGGSTLLEILFSQSCIFGVICFGKSLQLMMASVISIGWKTDFIVNMKFKLDLIKPHFRFHWGGWKLETFSAGKLPIKTFQLKFLEPPKSCLKIKETNKKKKKRKFCRLSIMKHPS